MAEFDLAVQMLDVLQACLHSSPSEWIFLRELRVGTGLRTRSGQRLDAFALNCLAHTAMRRICYEVKISRADFLCEMKQPIKRRVGLRYSNEFYFVTPVSMVKIPEVPIECGLIEVGQFSDEEKIATVDRDLIIHFAPAHNTFCRVTVPAPWRETPAPTWQFVAGMLRNQQRTLSTPPSKQPKQQRLALSD